LFFQRYSIFRGGGGGRGGRGGRGRWGRWGRGEQKFFSITRQNKFDELLVQNGVNKPTILNTPKAYTVFILTFDF
jgi:hypothetical protein